MTETEQKKMANLVKTLVFTMFEGWEYPLEYIEYAFKKAIKYSEIILDTKNFRKELVKAASIGTYKKEFEAIYKVLIKWKKKNVKK